MLRCNYYEQIRQYDSYDGAPFIEEATNGSVRFLDLILPQFWLPKYDWVMCLEVVEHIPGQHESTVLDNIVRPATEGVVLSWATPGQGGYLHVNEKSANYSQAEMRKRGLHLDHEATSKLRQAAGWYWLHNNVAVYRFASTKSQLSSISFRTTTPTTDAASKS